MNKLLVFLLIFPVLLSGCLDFGDDEVSSAPTKAQVDKCRLLMYIKPGAKIEPLGYKLSGSGIDDSVWFKFKTQSEPAELFDTEVVDVSKFKDGYKLMEVKGLEWWDVEGKKFHGGEVTLPGVKYMRVGLEKTEQGYTVYIMWFEV